MKAIILAAGMASRLRPLTLHTPKCLLKIGGRSLLQRSMDALIMGGIRQFVIVTGYLHEKIEDFVCQTYGTSIEVRFIHNEDYETTNNIYSLWLARPEADGEEILLLDSDLLYDAEIVKRILQFQGNSEGADDKNGNNVLTLIRHELGEEEMKVVMDENGAITEISKTCNPALAAGESLGIERMGKTYTTALYKELEGMMGKEHLENTFYELAFQRLIQTGNTFHVLDVTEFFSCELDTVEDFENVCRTFKA